MRKKIPEKIKPILEEVKENLKEFYGDKLKGIILYGSYARGEETEDSDIDLIILLERVPDTCEEVLRISRELGDLELTYDTLISIIPFEEYEFKSRYLPVILNAKREGIVL